MSRQLRPSLSGVGKPKRWCGPYEDPFEALSLRMDDSRTHGVGV